MSCLLAPPQVVISLAELLPAVLAMPVVRSAYDPLVQRRRERLTGVHPAPARLGGKRFPHPVTDADAPLTGQVKHLLLQASTGSGVLNRSDYTRFHPLLHETSMKPGLERSGEDHMTRTFRPVVAFDVDGTLIDAEDRPRPEIISILRGLAPWCTVVVWSGGGIGYARQWGRKLDLPPSVIYWTKGGKVDITFDDQEIKTMGTVNINVGTKGTGWNEDPEDAG